MIYFCFQGLLPTETMRWWQRVLNPNFLHIVIILPTPYHAVILEFNFWGMIFDYSLKPLDHILNYYLATSSAVIAVTKPYATADQDQFIIRGTLNCLTLAKSILCIRKPLILSPFQLYKYLLKDPKNNILKYG